MKQRSKLQLNGLDWRWLAGGGAVLGLLAGSASLLALDSDLESPWQLMPPTGPLRV